MSRRVVLVTLAFVALTTGCSDDPDPGGWVWDREIAVHGSLRAIHHDGAIGPAVALDTLVPDDSLLAIGALEGLAGEITIVGGRTYLSRPDGDGSRVELVERPDVSAALLVAASVPRWNTVVSTRPVRGEGFDDAIAGLAARAGWLAHERFPFVVEGRFEQLEWHVVDGSRLSAGGSSHEDHLAASSRHRRDQAEGMLVGFWSSSDRGIFTHPDSRTHIHCIVADPLGSGHVDSVVIPSGATFRFPMRGPR